MRLIVKSLRQLRILHCGFLCLMWMALCRPSAQFSGAALASTQCNVIAHSGTRWVHHTNKASVHLDPCCYGNIHSMYARSLDSLQTLNSSICVVCANAVAVGNSRTCTPKKIEVFHLRTDKCKTKPTMAAGMNVFEVDNADNHVWKVPKCLSQAGRPFMHTLTMLGLNVLTYLLFLPFVWSLAKTLVLPK